MVIEPNDARRALATELEATITATPDEASEVTLQAALAYSHEDFGLAMRMIAGGRVQLDPMHSRTVGLEELDAALADLASGTSSDMKVLVDPNVS